MRPTLHQALKQSDSPSPARSGSAAAEYQQLLSQISRIFEDARESTMIAVNKIRNRAYWLIGQRIVEVEQRGAVRAQYGEHLIENLSRDLSLKYSHGFSGSNLRAMRKFYLTHPDQQPPTDLSWTHYQMLLKVKNDQARQDLERRAVQQGWSKRELKRVLKSVEVEADPAASGQAAPASLARPSETLHPRRGIPYSYRIRRMRHLCGRPGLLAVDCGFGVFTDLPPEEDEHLKEGDIIRSVRKKKKEFRLKRFHLPDEGLYTYRAHVEGVTDDGALTLNIDCGFELWVRRTIPLRGVFPGRRDRGWRADAEQILRPLDFVVVRTSLEDSAAGGYVADVFYQPDEEDVMAVAAEGKFFNIALLE